MIGTPVTQYIWLGLHIRFLEDVQAGYLVNGEAHVTYNIRVVERYLSAFSLPVTGRAGRDLWDLATELEALGPDAVLSVPHSKKLTILVSDLKKVLAAESVTNLVYTVPPRRLDARRLIEDMPSLFGGGVFARLPDIAQYDFKEAGGCIAFGRPTAAAFHLLRGTESVLRAYYCSQVKRERVDPLLWGPMVAQLRKRRTRPPDVLLNNLDNIRISYRNPTQHPELRYDLDEAQDLCGLCIEVVNRMARDLPTAIPPAQP